MGYNTRQLKASPDPKAPAKPKDVIVDPKGQWKHPGKVTKIPSNNITMKGVPYPVLGIDNLGNQKMMYPELDYTFPGQSVTEYPQMHKMPDGSMMRNDEMQVGGWLDTMQKGGTKIYTDKDLYDKAHKAEMDSLNKYKLGEKRFLAQAEALKTTSDGETIVKMKDLLPKADKIKGVQNKPIEKYSVFGYGSSKPNTWNVSKNLEDINNPYNTNNPKSVLDVFRYKKPVIHNIYEPPVEPPQDTMITPVVPIKHSVYHPNYTQEIPGIKKSKQVTKQEGGATSLRAVPTYASEKEQNKYTPYQRMVLQARANNQADREYNTVTGFVNLASHVPGPSQLLFSGLSSAVDFTEDNYAKSLLGLVPYKPFKIADAAGDVKDMYEQKKGGSVKGLSKFTSKNIKTSVNKLQMRNETLFGERGRKIYHPDAKGWLDNYK